MDEIFFDYATKEYVELQCAAIRSEIYAHAGGGGSGGGAVYATFTYNTRPGSEDGWFTCDKTYAELKAAYDAGSIIFGFYGGMQPMAYRTMGDASAFVYCNLTAELSYGAINTLVRVEIAVLNDGTIQGNKVTKSLAE